MSLSPETIAELRALIDPESVAEVASDELAELLDAYESVEKYKACADEAIAERNEIAQMLKKTMNILEKTASWLDAFPTDLLAELDDVEAFEKS